MSEKSLAFHIKVDDYFGTLATILDLLRQNSEKGIEKEEMEAQLERLTKDLLYLQDNFQIVPKT